VQEDIADRVEMLLAGAMEELKLGDPSLLTTDIGPVIDAEALERLEAHAARIVQGARWSHRLTPPAGLTGTFCAPLAVEIKSLSVLEQEVFGPILHVLRWRAKDLDALVDSINATGYGLTLGIHTRIDSTVARIRARARRQHLRQPQHDRCGGGGAAVRRHGVVGHRSEGRRSALPASFRLGTDLDDQHRRGRRQRLAARLGRLKRG